MAEGGIGWVAMLLDRLDNIVDRSGYGLGWDERPAEVLRRSFWFCTIDDPSTIDTRHAIGVDHIMVEIGLPPRRRHLARHPGGHRGGVGPSAARRAPGAVLRERGRAVPPPPARRRAPEGRTRFVTKAHHTAICTTDVDASLRFWRDGLGLRGDDGHGLRRRLADAVRGARRAAALGLPRRPGRPVRRASSSWSTSDRSPTAPPAAAPTTGFFLVSVYLDVDAALARLAELDLGGSPRRITVHGVSMAVVRDPNGVRVELIGLPG